MSYNPRDRFFLKAKKENFAARSVYKLQEIDTKYRIFRSGQVCLDLGCSPGSWSQYASQKVGERGRVLGVDLQPVTVSLPNAVFIEADLRDLKLEDVFREHGFEPPFDVVISDMAPKTTGIKFTDQARSMELCELALQTASRFLKPGGAFVCKFFESGDFAALRKQFQNVFRKVEFVKPESTRSMSKEIFFVGLDKKG
ncbi:MAG: RlmE family RNA methyltransferase [Bdellovibrionales bacterium]|nr:RlmE family RNA methyltransferase [Bdellovibrionales bacterium]MBL7689403.1 RlmE family RNA methyltransferase [Pseudobdellovibrionaceae bacterium]